MKTLSYWLVAVGIVLALGGVMAVFSFDQPSDMFSLAWWMIVGGWSLALTGMSIDILHLCTVVKREPVYTFYPEVEKANGVGEEVTRV